MKKILVVGILTMAFLGCFDDKSNPSVTNEVDQNKEETVTQAERDIHAEIIKMHDKNVQMEDVEASIRSKKFSAKTSSGGDSVLVVDYSDEVLEALSLDPEKLRECFSGTDSSDFIHFENANKQLSELPIFQEYLEMSEIKNCSDAKKFIQTMYEILHKIPSPEMIKDGEHASEEVQSLSKVALENGRISNGNGLVYYEVGGGSCSGTLISPRVIATAGHCLRGMGRRARVKVDYFDPNNATGVPTEIADEEMDLIMYREKLSQGDAPNDFGLIIKDTPWNTNDPEFRKIYVGTMANARHTNIYGAGLSYENNQGIGVGTMRVGDEYVRWYGSQHFLAYANSGGTRNCGGDSGGPWTRKGFHGEAITGVTSGFGPNPWQWSTDGYCADKNNKMRASRLSGKIWWINQILSAYNEMECELEGDYRVCYPDGETNKALGRPVTVSSSYSSRYSGHKLTNGLINSTTSKWNSKYAANGQHWAIIDLERYQEISSYIIKHAGVLEPQKYNTKRWSVYSSNDGVNWTWRHWVGGNTKKVTYEDLDNFYARYLKFQIWDAGENYARIYEIEIY